MEINNIKLKNKKNTNIFLIDSFDGEYEIHSDIIVKYNIAKGYVDDKKFMSAKQESDVLIAFNLATKYVSAKIKNEKQIKDYLLKKGFEFYVIKLVIEKLKEYKIVDDNLYTQSYINSNKNFSKNKLKQKLFSSGIKSDMIEENLENVDDFSSCLNNALKFLKNKEKTNETKEKLFRRLQYLGYGWETIKSVLNKINFEED